MKEYCAIAIGCKMAKEFNTKVKSCLKSTVFCCFFNTSSQHFTKGKALNTVLRCLVSLRIIPTMLIFGLHLACQLICKQLGKARLAKSCLKSTVFCCFFDLSSQHFRNLKKPLRWPTQFFIVFQMSPVLLQSVVKWRRSSIQKPKVA